MATLAVQCPDGCPPGTILAAQTPDGQTVNVQVPADCVPGGIFHVMYTPLDGSVPAEPQEAAAVTMCEEDIPGSALLNPDDYEAPLSAGGPTIGEDTTGTYHYAQAPAYQVGQVLNVLRSDETWSPCTITAAHITAMGPIYDVDLGGVCKSGVEEGHLSTY